MKKEIKYDREFGKVYEDIFLRDNDKLDSGERDIWITEKNISIDDEQKYDYSSKDFTERQQKDLVRRSQEDKDFELQVGTADPKKLNKKLKQDKEAEGWKEPRRDVKDYVKQEILVERSAGKRRTIKGEIRNCLFCGREYEISRRDQKFCNYGNDKGFVVDGKKIPPYDFYNPPPKDKKLLPPHFDPAFCRKRYNEKPKKKESKK